MRKSSRTASQPLISIRSDFYLICSCSAQQDTEVVLCGFCAKAAFLHWRKQTLYLNAQHDGHVFAHIDVVGKVRPDIARICSSVAATGVTVWDVKATTDEVSAGTAAGIDAESRSKSGVFRRRSSAVQCIGSARWVILADARNGVSLSSVGQQRSSRVRPFHSVAWVGADVD